MPRGYGSPAAAGRGRKNRMAAPARQMRAPALAEEEMDDDFDAGFEDYQQELNQRQQPARPELSRPVGAR